MTSETKPAAGEPRLRPGWRSRPSPARATMAIGTTLILVMVAITTALAVRRYDAELMDAARELRTLDLVLAEEADRSLQSVQLVIDNVADQAAAEGALTAEAFATRMATKPVHESLRGLVAGVPQLDAVTVISAQGKLINFSRAWPIPDVDLKDRDYFSHLRDAPHERTFLSQPVVNRGSGTPTIYLARRVDAPDGTFIGLVLGAIELSYFDRFYALLHLEPGNVVALWRRDGVLLARYPPAAPGGRRPPDRLGDPAASWHQIPDVFEKSCSIDGTLSERCLVATQPASGFPLQVDLGRRKSLILDDWKREVAAVGSAVAIAILCVLVLLWALLRRFNAYEAVAAASKERERAIVARQEAEQALRQAQKMEAVGQLTGGVAHDFNNLLTVMRGSVDLLRRPGLSEERRTRYVDAIGDATDRAATLTGQLLAFARRQALQPEVFDVAADVAAIAGLVDRLTGSRVDVETRLPDRVCPVDADQNQFDTSIFNMAVNGRDAMPEGGRLTIAVEPVGQIPATRSSAALAGPFVAVSVSDTGSGISPDLVDRVFEPFFTTKKVGEGTGLGLSQVFGFAKQSGGDVTVDSIPGRGTTFTLYLPQVAAVRMKSAPKAIEPAAVQTGQGARVLVVEDNEQVGRSTLQTLADLGYQTVWAASAEDALAEIEGGRDRFDLVFSDVVMRGMSGVELGRTLRRRFQGLPVVLTSGYSQTLAEEGPDGFMLVQKPYTRAELSRVLHDALAVERARRSAADETTQRAAS